MKKNISQNQTATLRSIFLMAIILGLAGAGWGQTAGPSNSTLNTYGTPGTTTWSNIGNLNVNGSYTQADMNSNGSTTSQTIRATGYSFSSIPDDAIINAIQVIVRRYGETSLIQDNVVQLTKDGTNGVGDNKANIGSAWPTSYAEATYGNTTNDLWNTNWAASDLKAPTFGVLFRVINTRDGWFNRWARVDYIRITVYYTVKPDCSAITYPANSSIGVERNPTFNWNSAATATGYKFYLGTSTGNYDLVNDVLLTTTSYTYGSLLTANTGYYWKVVPTNTSGDATDCTEWSFTTGDDIFYCNSQGTSQAGEYISNIVVGDYSKASGSSGYSDFTSEIIQVDNSTNPSFTLTPSSTTNDKYWAVWIDFNSNGDFTDPGEEVYSGYSKTAPTGTLSNIAGKVIDTRMRIAMKGDPGNADLTVPGGMITAEHNDSPAGEEIDKLIDNSTATKYLTLNGAAGGNYVWVQYQFPNSEKYVVTKYSMTSANDFPERDPLIWTLQGSYDGSSWTTIDNQSNQDFPTRFLRREFTCTNTTAYNYYRLNMRNNSGNILQLAEWELFGISMPTPCETFAFGEVEDYTVNIEPSCSNSTAPTSITGTASICPGGSTTLTSSGGSLGTDAIDVWYAGACAVEDFTEEWTTQPYTVNNTTVNSVNNGILNVTSSSGDPMIVMTNIGSFNTTTYKWIQLRYRVVSGTAGIVEIYYSKTGGSDLSESQVVRADLISDGDWHIVNVDMSASANWTGTITGWRYDWCAQPGVTMELDFITLANHPILATGPFVTVSPTATTTYFTRKKGDCNSTACASLEVTIGSIPTASVSGQSDITCFAANDGTITITASDGTGPYEFSIDNGLNYISGTNPYTFASLEPGTYYVRVKDANGCESPLCE